MRDRSVSKTKSSTKRASQARELLYLGQLAKAVAGQAKLAEEMVLGKWDPDQQTRVPYEWLKPERRAEFEASLIRAWEVLRGPGWQGATGAREVVKALESAAAMRQKSEHEALAYAVGRIRGVLNDVDAPTEWSTVEPDPKLVAAALAALRRGRRGRPGKFEGQGSADEKIAVLLAQLGLSGASARGVKELRNRRRAKKA